MRQVLLAVVALCSVAGCGSNPTPANTPNLSMPVFVLPDLKMEPGLADMTTPTQAGTLTCGDIIGCTNPCTNTACINNCLKMGQTKSAMLWTALDDCISNTCANPDGDADFATCQSNSQCSAVGKDYSGAADPTCKAKGACYDALVACGSDM